MRLIKSVLVFVTLFVMTSVCHAATWVVGPNSNTPAPALPFSTYYGGDGQPVTMDICAAIVAASPGDTIEVDYNNGIPYHMTPWHNGAAGGSIDCWIQTNNLTIIGFNGRPIIDLTGEGVYKAPFDFAGCNCGTPAGGSNDTLINFEIRGAVSSHSDSTSAIRIESGTTGSPAGGDITIQYCYIHDNGGDGMLVNGVGTFSGNAFGVPNAYITLLNDELGNNGFDDYGYQHNMYIGADDSGQEVFNMYYTWTHDAVAGHTVKTRAPNNNIYYNLIGDAAGQTNTLIDMPFGGSTYIVGNSFYRVQTNQNNNSGNVILFDYDSASPGGYGPPTENNPPYNYQDLHVVNNTFVIDPGYNTPAYVAMPCTATPTGQCSSPGTTSLITVPAVIENNIFIGPAGLPITNQTTAVLGTTAVPNSNLVLTNNSTGGYPTVPQVPDVLMNGSAVTGLFANPEYFDFHLLPGAASAIGQGITPTLSDGVTPDPKAVAQSEFLIPGNSVARPNVKDLGAYSYPRADTPPATTLTCSASVTTPGTGTFTVSGLPTPTPGAVNTVTFESENTAVIADTGGTSTSTSVTGSFSAVAPLNGSSTTGAPLNVPIDVYAQGEHLTCNVEVITGPPTLVSITEDNGNGSGFAGTSVNLANPPTETTGPITVALTSNSPYLIAPTSVTIPVGAVTAETGTNTGLLWGQSPSTQPVTVTATYNSQNVSLSFGLAAPIIGGYCSIWDPGCDIVGGQNLPILVDSYFSWPLSGANFVCTSSDTVAIPNQNFNIPGPGFYVGQNIQTNPVTTDHLGVSFTCTANGSGGSYGPVNVHAGTAGVPVAITVVSGSGQSAAVTVTPTNFAQPLVVVVKDNLGNPVSGATVYFTGTGVSFPGVLAGYPVTATTNASGLASTLAYPTQGGAVSVSASFCATWYGSNCSTYGSFPAVLSETGNITTPTAIIATSGSGQTSSLNVNFPLPLVATVTGAGSTPVFGAVVTVSGTNVSFPNGTTYVTNSSGQISVVAAPTAAGPLTITATTTGGSGPLTATFSETGITAVPASVTYVSGNDQSVSVGSPFANPLIVIVKDAGGNPVPGVAVNFTYSGSNVVTFSGGGLAVTNSSGLASITATPDNVGTESIIATVTGLSVVNFTETSTSNGPYLASITWDNQYGDGSTVNLSAPATSPVVVTLTSSNPSALYIPASVVVPVGSQSAETGSMLGSAWGQSPGTQATTLTAIANGVTVQYNATIYTLQVHNFWCGPNPCTVVSGNPIQFGLQTAFGATPYGGMQMIVTSDTPAVIPNQNLPLPAGSGGPAINVATNAGVSSTTTVNLTFNFNGIIMGPYQVTVTPGGAVPTSITVSSGSGQSAAVGSNFASNLCALVQASSTPLSGVVVTFNATGDSFQWGNNQATTNGSGIACVTAGAIAMGSIPVVASVSGSSGPLTTTFTETGLVGPAASITVVSGSGQSSNDGTNFTNPLVAVVKDSAGDVVPGILVTYSGTGVSFPSGATSTTNSSGQSSVVVQPTACGSLTVSAAAAGVAVPAAFAETGANCSETTSTTVSTAPNPSTYGQNVTFTATVMETSGTTTPAGTVQFSVNGTPTGPAVTINSSGVGTYTMSTLLVGSYAITAAYTPGSGSFQASTSNTTTQVVNKGTGTLTLSSANGISTFGVTPVVSPDYTLTGFQGTDTQALVCTGLPSVSTTATASSPVSGATYPITAALGTLVCASSNITYTVNIGSNSGQLTIDKASATLTLSSANGTSPLGATPVVSSFYTLSGFQNGDTQATACTGAPAMSTTATSASPLSPPTYPITAGVGTLSCNSSADYNYTIVIGSNSGQLTIIPATSIGTTTVLGTSANPATAGVAVIFTATVTQASGTNTPTGTVTFSYNSSVLCSGVAVVSGVATCSNSTLPLGLDPITAVYTPTGVFVASTSNTVNQDITAALVGTTTALVSATNPSTSGVSVTFTATVTQASGTNVPTGSVTFSNGGTTLGTVSLSSGVAIFSTSTLPVGTDPITAVYVPTGNFTASTSNTVNQVVNSGSVATTTAVSTSGTPSTYGANVTFTATVGSGSGTPTGTVQFSIDGSAVGSAVTLSGGLATYMTATLAVGTHTVTAVYTPTGLFLTSNGTLAGGQVVNKASATLTLTTTNNPSNPIAYGSTVPSVAADYTLIGFIDGDTQASACTGTSTLGTTATSSSTPGSYPITAVIGSLVCSSTDVTYTVTIVGGGNVVIGKASATLTLTTTNNPSNPLAYGSAVPSVAADYTLTGFQGTDTQASACTGAPSLTTTATSSSAPGSYPITAVISTLACSSTDYTYTVTIVNTGNVVINKASATLTLTSTNGSGTVGTSPVVTGDYTLTGFQGTDTQASACTGAPSITTTATSSSPVSPPTYPITAANGTLACSSTDYTYTITDVSTGVYTVNPAGTSPLTLTTTNNPSNPIAYGSAVPSVAADYTLTGFIGGDTQASACTGTPTLSTTATSSSAPGSYPITAVVGTLVCTSIHATYTVTIVNTGNVVINKATAALTLTTTSPAPITYGSTVPSVAADYTLTGFQGTDTQGNACTGTPTLSTTATSSSPVGSYPITAIIGSLVCSSTDYTYTVTLVNTGNVVINKATANLTLTSTNGSGTTGVTPVVSSDYSLTGFVGSDTQASACTGAPSVTTTATASSPASPPTYPITAAVGTLACSSSDYNYTVMLGSNSGQLTLTGSTGTTPQTITFPIIPYQSYGAVGTVFNPGATASSGLTVTYTVVYGPATVSGSGVLITGSGDITVTASQSGNSTYSAATPITRTFSVLPSGVSWPSPSTITYGTPASAFMTVVSTITTGTTVYSNGAQVLTPTTVLGAGKYSISAVFTASAGWVLKIPLTLIVSPAPLTVTVNNLSVTYSSQIPPSYGYVIAGYVNGDQSSVVTGVPTITTTATTKATKTAGVSLYTSSIGSYALNATTGSLKASNYMFTFVPGTLTITPALTPLTITATNVNIMYPTSLPATFLYTVTGLLGFDSATTAGTGTPSLTSTATTSSPAGTYPITVTAGTFSAPNYSGVNYVNGTVSIVR